MSLKKLIAIISTCILISIFGSYEVMVEANDDEYEEFDPEEEGYDVIEPLENAEEVLEETIELPDIYENTIIYNGTISPEFNFFILMPDGETLDDIYINESGQFSFTFFDREFQAGEEITFQFNVPATGGTYENSIPVEVLSAEDGMEIVESSADTSDVQNAVIEETQFDWQEQEEAILLDVETVGNVDGAPYYTVNDEPITYENRLEHIQENLNRATFSTDNLEIGDLITVYVVASGVTTPVQVEVPDSLTVLQDETGEESTEGEDEDLNGESEDSDEEVENIDEENEVDEADQPETEGEETEDEGISTGWIAAGVVLVLAVIGGIIYTIRKRRR